MLKPANLALRFLPELAGAGGPRLLGLPRRQPSFDEGALGIGAPAVAAVVWAAALGLYATARRSVAIGYAIVVGLNAALMAVWNQ